MWGETGWGVPTSVALHLALAFLLLVRLPDHAPPAKEQSLNVELVSPPMPEAKPQEKPEEAKPEPARSQPQVFESASAEVDKEKPPRPQLPPAAPSRIDKPKSPDAQAKPAPAKTESADKPAETRTALAELRVEAEDAVSKAEDAEPAPQSAPVPKKSVAEEAKADAAPRPSEAASERQPSELVQAKRLYSKDALSDPRVKQAIGRLPPKRRIVQLCTIEALEQVRRQRPDAFPDMLVPFGPVGGLVSASGLSASGGAYRSRGKWYGIDFKCEVNSETTSVASFSFAIGGAIPKSEWGVRQLPKD
ncbi:outer membrane biosynthesis protein TonB [Sinorhizobium fredii]